MRTSLCGALLVTCLAFGARAQGEPPGLMALVKAQPSAEVAVILKEARFDACREGVLKPVAEGIPCRLAVAAHIAGQPIAVDAKDVAITMRRAAVDDALAVSANVPAPSAGVSMARLRFETTREACAVMFNALRSYDRVPAKAAVRPAAVAAKTLVAGLSLRNAACSCATEATKLAVGANAPPDEAAAAHGMLTANRCLTDGKGFVIADRSDPQKAFDNGSVDTRVLADANSPAGRLVAMAEGRLVEMGRCTNKHVKKGIVDDVERMTRCACGVVGRWAMPFKRSDPTVVASLPVVEGGGIVLPVQVENAKITQCGPVEGPMVTAASKPAPTAAP